MTKIKSSVGQKIGRLTVINEYYKIIGNRNRIIQHCYCECGKTVERIKSSDVMSCGCLKKKNIDRIRSKIKEHWRSMISRCNDDKPHHYKFYKGKGITVCERWLNFDNFHDDMRPTWNQGLELDRIKNNKGYFKENCRWVTNQEQQRNRSNVKLSLEDVEEIKNSNLWQKEIAQKYGISQSHVSKIKCKHRCNL